MFSRTVLICCSAFAVAAAEQGTSFLSTVNATFGVAPELEYELHLDEETTQNKDKAILAIISLLGLSGFGVDRCYLGQIGCGLLKGVTFGGLGIWAIIDGVVVIVNLFTLTDEINSLGFHATFIPSSVKPAFWWATFTLFFHFFFQMFCNVSIFLGRYVATKSVNEKKQANANNAYVKLT
mmetsp:Transcript_34092/g.90902  ORF Transcript_34092/g.90902 Transcript_34092/m.90902 type:complete len:180 (-) Transcript_34092:201-740(-)|eukprot:CAMPEP_0194526620 /NCGR_PEP_ID=MMETSP0253-20130528/62477_1 /TAXON_ID=2966 /ORGANISM="Noctiluca scintillans" /LENGTH=179 /DNA_ID=CAMNT_0039371463 /DNA_START=41 /DNA_END=580 /DNA_ORIENTATION=-